MTLRDDIQPIIDDGRQLVADFGLRARRVQIWKRTWSGTEVDGEGGEVVEALQREITPPPKVKEPPARLVFDAPGKYEQGDLLITKISRAYSEEDLDGGQLGSGETWLYFISTDDHTWREYTVIGPPAMKNFAWEILVRESTRVPRSNTIQTLGQAVETDTARPITPT